MSSRALVTLAICGVLGAALLVGAKREAIGDFVRFQIDAKRSRGPRGPGAARH